MPTYQTLSVPVNIGIATLNNEAAYFLGGVIAANEAFNIRNEKLMWLAPVRHNAGQASDIELDYHFISVLKLAGKVGKVTLDKSSLKMLGISLGNKAGFGTLFESSLSTSIDDISYALRPTLAASSDEVKRCFIAGAFDGRSSLDVNKATGDIRNIVLDCGDDNAAELLKDSLRALSIYFNYNTARDRLEGGRPRKPQLRLPSSNAFDFAEKIGFISPFRLESLRKVMPGRFIIDESSVLTGLKTLQAPSTVSSSPTMSARILSSTMPPVVHRVAPAVSTASATSDRKIIKRVFSDEETAAERQADIILQDELENADESIASTFEYSATSKEKQEPVIIGKRKTYKRDKQVALNALLKANCKCEVFPNHPTFKRKKTNIDYMEPHHLVPLSYSDEFDVSLDVEENVVSLCSNCHNQLHYGSDIESILKKLYDERKDFLHSVGIDITFEELLDMYK